jgi:cysteine-rich repeat protein
LGSAPEACDDGNTSSGDGCSATCELEPFALTVTKLGSGVGSVVSSAPGINCGTDCSELYASGAVVTLTATPGASTAFTGWSGGGCNGTGTCVVTLSAARSVLATFQLDVLNVALAGSGAGVITGTGISCGPDCSEVFDAGAVVTLIPIPAADSNFAGWSGDCVGLACALTMSSARNVTATFNLNQYLLSVSKVGQGTINSGPAGIACGPDCTEPYASGTSVTLVASPQAGWSFSSWSGAAGCTTSPICAVTVTASQTVTATFTQNTYVLTTVKTGNGTGVVTSSPGTINCGATCAATFFSGASVLLTANAATNNTFLGWSGAGCTGTGTCAVAMNQAETVSARFGLVPRLLTVTKAGVNAPLGSVTVTPAGINCGAGCTSYDDGTVVVLTAAPGVAPDGGSTFTGWTGCSSATGLLCVVTMNAARNVNATFD